MGICACSSMVEHPAHNGNVVGSIPTRRSVLFFLCIKVIIAQLVEHWFVAPKVMGSIPINHPCVLSSEVEQQPSKLMVIGSIPIGRFGVWPSGRAVVFGTNGRRFESFYANVFICRNSSMVEHRNHNPLVVGSNPISGIQRIIVGMWQSDLMYSTVNRAPIGFVGLNPTILILFFHLK